jgi:hypothetical protein
MISQTQMGAALLIGIPLAVAFLLAPKWLKAVIAFVAVMIVVAVR